MTSKSDEFWMNIALEQARQALAEDEVPVGAVLVSKDKLILSNHNRTRQLNDPLAHAEKLIIEKIISDGEKYLFDHTLYVTVEPCLMCAGMIIWTRVGRIVYGCSDPKSGAAGSIYNTLLDRNLNHNPELVTGILATECRNLMQEFFHSKR